MELGREMSLEEDCLLNLSRNISGRRTGVSPTSVAGLTEIVESGTGEVTLDPVLVKLKPSNETTKPLGVLDFNIVETRKFTTSHT